ncbi:hypothetical protein OIU85_000174 [Salix viminalis]|uniref:NAD(P)-binding domain-containing protein n=1 Tax=Salix viminalis TaxID=40686 RepID=A0A9Q0VJF7_SALVM|nr:hypothetical protein OIU85_000174 [Salix viminalis]
MAAHKVKTLIYSSTCATYGEPVKMPITEKTPQLPINPYGKAKKMAEDIIIDFSKTTDMAVMILRYFNDSRLKGQTIKQLMARIYNVGTGKGRSVKEFVEACKKATGVEIKVEYLGRRPGDYAEVFSDPSKVKQELNWTAQYTNLKKSLQIAWKWQKSHLNGYSHS